MRQYELFEISLHGEIRTVDAENANGKVEVILPGKEGIALLAVRQ